MSDRKEIDPVALGLKQLKRLQLALRVVARLRPSEQHVIYVWAALVGLLGAFAAIAFQLSTSYIQLLLTGQSGSYVEVFHSIEPWQRLTVPVVGALCAGLVLMFGKRFVRARETDYMEAVALGDGKVPVQGSLVRSLSAMFSIGSGASIGREGPLVQLAAVVSSFVATLRGMAPPKRRLLVACGASAGIAAAYHAPLGGAIFVAEIVIGSFAMESLGPLLIASIVSVLTIRSFGMTDSLYHFTGGSGDNLFNYLFYPGLGILCGAAAGAWMRLLKTSRFRFGAIPGPLWLRLTLGGVLTGAIAYWYPEVTGNGASVIRNMLNDQYTLPFIGTIFLLKVAATCAVFGSGAVGGVFTPSLLVGACAGILFASGANLLIPGVHLDIATFAAAGMTALLAAAAQAPFTAIILLFEMTSRYDLVLPLSVSAIAAYACARAIGTHGLYEESLRAGPRSVFDRPLSEITIGDILRPEPPSVPLNAPFREIAKAFLGGAGRELWVVDHQGRLLGEIILPDVEPYLREPELAMAVIAGDLMHEGTPHLTKATTLPLALDTYSRSDAETLAVVDPASGKLLGAVGRGDLYLTLSELTRRERSKLED